MPPVAESDCEYKVPTAPSGSVAGEVIVTGDTAVPIVKAAELETAPPGFWTVMLALPLFAIRLPGTVADNWVALTKLVRSGEPFHSTLAEEVKIPPED